MDIREYVIALSVVCRPAKALETMKLAFKVCPVWSFSNRPAEYHFLCSLRVNVTFATLKCHIVLVVSNFASRVYRGSRSVVVAWKSKLLKFESLPCFDLNCFIWFFSKSFDLSAHNASENWFIIYESWCYFRRKAIRFKDWFPWHVISQLCQSDKPRGNVREMTSALLPVLIFSRCLRQRRTVPSQRWSWQ